MALRDIMKASPAAVALREAAIEWAKATQAPVTDPEDRLCAKADRALRAAAVRYANALRAEEEARMREPCEW